MPFVKVYLREGKSEEFVRSAGDAIHRALVSEASVPADDRFQVFLPLAEGHMVAHPSYGGVSRTEALLIVEITLNAGRTVEVKKALYAGIARNLADDLAIRPDDVLISLVEVTKENWSFGGGRATYA
jgi:phenylpyruvate tautomerase PptA (4-oxalocrotonate tautomerase family)